jgi:hypothetical protein
MIISFILYLSSLFLVLGKRWVWGVLKDWRRGLILPSVSALISLKFFDITILAFSHVPSLSLFFSEITERPVIGQYTLTKLVCAMLRNTSFPSLFIDIADCLYLHNNDTHYSVVFDDSELLEAVILPTKADNTTARKP